MKINFFPRKIFMNNKETIEKNWHEIKIKIRHLPVFGFSTVCLCCSHCTDNNHLDYSDTDSDEDDEEQRSEKIRRCSVTCQRAWYNCSDAVVANCVNWIRMNRTRKTRLFISGESASCVCIHIHLCPDWIYDIWSCLRCCCYSEKWKKDSSWSEAKLFEQLTTLLLLRRTAGSLHTGTPTLGVGFFFFSFPFPLLELYLWRGPTQYTLCLNMEGVSTSVHLCQHFLPETSSTLSLSFTQGNIHSPGSHTPFTLHRQLQPHSTTVGLSGREGEGGLRGIGRREGCGWNSPSCQSPSKQTHAKAPCVYKQLSWIRLDVYSGLIWAKPNTLWAIKGDGWVIGTLSFFGKCKHIYYAPPLQAVQIKISAASRENKHHAVWLLRTWKTGLTHIATDRPRGI